MIPDILLTSPLLGLTVTLIAYKFGERLVERFNITFLPPLLTACAILIAIINFTSLFTYEQYAVGGSIINFLLGPATIALALPLVRNFKVLCQHYKILLSGAIVGTLAGVISITLCAKFFGASEQVVLSGAKIGNNPYCHGYFGRSWRHTSFDCGLRYFHRHLWCYVRS